MQSSILPQDQVFWYLNAHDSKPLTQNLSTDVVIVGGGMAGLSAAQRFAQKGLSVVLVEKNYCGSGASGKSSGFITPDSELSLRHLMHLYGQKQAKELWDFVDSGVTFIKNNIETFDISCDYQVQDSLVVATSKSAFDDYTHKEYASRSACGYASTLYTPEQLPTVLGSTAYHGGIAYSGTFGINAYQYCQGMKKVLQNRGVQIYEETPALQIAQNVVKTPQATITAKYIIVCADRFIPFLGRLKQQIYHAQTFLMISSPLSNEQIKTIFPQNKYMVWDTDLLYQYYRVTGDNRLMLGGANLRYTFAKEEKHNNQRIIDKFKKYYAEKIPECPVTFEYIWPGLVGISKDLLPLAGRDATDSSIYYISAVAGLPWAAALGSYSAEHIINNETKFDHYFSPYRSVTLGPISQAILGTRLTFALSNLMQLRSL